MSETRELSLNRTIDAPPEKVWDAMADQPKALCENA